MMIICTWPDPPDDQLQEAVSSGQSFPGGWILRMISCKRPELPDDLLQKQQRQQRQQQQQQHAHGTHGLKVVHIPYICHFFTHAKFLENKIYTEIYTVNWQFTQ